MKKLFCLMNLNNSTIIPYLKEDITHTHMTNHLTYWTQLAISNI